MPGRIVLMERPGAGGYVQEGLDEEAKVARLRWVAERNSTVVTVAVLKAVGLIPSP
ncbi:hypothetical protein [Saccharopolyspora elongata]|uniref:hypothetical protein n=1 Tax=Saccharopolyspora elongata TaxID=2530387 RepID=UPI0014043BBD|nr:hypothetical protein [Saccharopolyspora elongata]